MCDDATIVKLFYQTYLNVSKDVGHDVSPTKEVIKLEPHFSEISILFASFNAGLLVLIWLVQVIIYPGMHNWVTSEFSEIHRVYTRKITFIVTPLMLGQALCALLMTIRAPDVLLVLQLILIAFVWGVTAFISVPLHRRLSGGHDNRVIDRLIKTNWLRTMGWSLICLLDWIN